jgi:hypothetical protein
MHLPHDVNEQGIPARHMSECLWLRRPRVTTRAALQRQDVLSKVLS